MTTLPDTTTPPVPPPHGAVGSPSLRTEIQQEGDICWLVAIDALGIRQKIDWFSFPKAGELHKFADTIREIDRIVNKHDALVALIERAAFGCLGCDGTGKLYEKTCPLCADYRAALATEPRR